MHTPLYSKIKFSFKLYTRRFLSFIFSKIGYQINLNSKQEVIISNNLESTLTKIDIGNIVLGMGEISDRNFKNFIIQNHVYLKNGIQALRILYLFKSRPNGFFVEFGGGDGILHSNTYLLEKEFGWTGILVEPSKGYGDSICRNRTAIIDRRAVWSKSGEVLEFAEVSANGLSGIASTFRKNQIKKRLNLGIKKYSVFTVSLNDLLSEYNAPNNFEFLSIDTEGSELEIIKNFNLEKFRPKVITIEHAGDAKYRLALVNHISKFGYKSIDLEINDRKNLWMISSESYPSK